MIHLWRLNMKTNERLNHTLIGLLLGAIFCLFWVSFGEPWEVLGDGKHYLEMLRGHIETVPFGYRAFTPYVASLLPWQYMTNFTVVTLTSLTLATAVVGFYAVQEKKSIPYTLILCGLWGTSFSFVYYGTTFIRADAPMFLCLWLVFTLSHQHKSIVLLFLIATIGQLAHETMLIFLPIFWLEKFFGGRLSGARYYSYLELVLLSAALLLVYITVRKTVATLPGVVNYLNTSPKDMLDYVLGYTGGVVRHAMRVYAAFGPLVLFTLAYLVTQKRKHEIVPFALYLGLVMCLTLVSTDTLRVMVILIIPMSVYAARYLYSLYSTGKKQLLIALLALQAAYSYLVYGHLRTFENSVPMNRVAIALSVAALLTCLYSLLKDTRALPKNSAVAI
jgi:hypothetical protein